MKSIVSFIFSYFSEKERAEREAIRELSSMSDKQLNELGLGRGSIRNAVKHGVNY